MLNHLLRLALVSTAWLYLRTRWKRLLACAAAALIAIHLHAEYVEYVATLPASAPAAVATGDHLLLALILKNVVVGVSILVVIVPELWRSPGRRRQPKHEAGARPGVAASTDHGPVEAAPSNEGGDDGFDFLRHPRKLASRSEQIIRGKPSQ